MMGRRIIPARAGVTLSLGGHDGSLGDHPRSRGVYCVLRSRAAGLIWIIPARAGFTTAASGVATSSWDHPRSRGVYQCGASTRSPCTGSSPLARGLRLPRPRGRVAAGIIPARAGFTRRGQSGWESRPDHPRSRGVYSGTRRPMPSVGGSSPLARGLQRTAPRSGGPPGIIPARAGFTADGLSCAPRCRDHPRSRGVYSDFASARLRRTGSSPLARGLHLRIVGIPTNP